jgi:hypothetical protein
MASAKNTSAIKKANISSVNLVTKCMMNTPSNANNSKTKNRTHRATQMRVAKNSIQKYLIQN